MGYRIVWKSCSQWVGTELTTHDGDDEYETREQAEAALAEMNNDTDLMYEVHAAAIESQGVEGWLKIEEAAE